VKREREREREREKFHSIHPYIYTIYTSIHQYIYTSIHLYITHVYITTAAILKRERDEFIVTFDAAVKAQEHVKV